MVAEPREEFRSRDTRKGDGVAARFRPLGGDGPDRPEPPSAPAFGTAPWGYKRAEVDAWMSWMSGLVEHGRRETQRADSAEATLKATLDQLEQLHSLETPGGWPGGADDGDPDGHAPDGTGGPARTPDPLPRRLVRAPDPDPPQADGGPAPAAAEQAPPADPPPDVRTAQEPRTAQGSEPRATTAPDRDPDRPELARLQVVETTLHEVMGLLNRLVESGRGTDRPRDDGR